MSHPHTYLRVFLAYYASFPAEWPLFGFEVADFLAPAGSLAASGFAPRPVNPPKFRLAPPPRRPCRYISSGAFRISYPIWQLLRPFKRSRQQPAYRKPLEVAEGKSDFPPTGARDSVLLSAARRRLEDWHVLGQPLAI